MKRSPKAGLCGSSTVLLAFLAGGAHAQTAAAVSAAAQPSTNAQESAAGSRVSEVVVTAQRRSESLQRTSVVLNVVSATELSRSGVTNPQSLTTILPGVQIGAASSTLQIYIRGVGDFGSTANSNPAVAFNIDGAYVGRSNSVPSEFYDVDRVEVLKGPQGTLYGRNASGGAINLITKNPVLGKYTGDFSGEVGNYSSYSGEGGVNIPLGPTLAARLSGTYVDKGGYTSEGYDDDKHEAGRLKLLWEPSSDVSVLLNGSYGHVGGKGSGYVLVNKVPGLPNKTPFTDATDPSVRSFIIGGISPTLPPIPGLFNPAQPQDGYQDMTFYNVSAEITANLGFATLTLMPAYRNASLLYTTPTLLKYELGAGFDDHPRHPETSDQTSVEARLSNDTTRLKWVVGGYFYNEDQYTQYIGPVGLISDTADRYTYNTQSYAAFGQATYTLTSTFRLIGGLRYTSDKVGIDGARTEVAPSLSCFPAGPAGATCPIENFAGNKTFSNLSYKAGVEADVAPESLFFATISTGYKAGGFNSLVAPTAPAGSTEAYPFRPEKLTAYEVGLKSRFLQDRLQLNLEGFYWDYTDHQELFVTVSGTGSPSSSFINAGSARMFGGSADMIFKPWRNGTFTGDVEYDNTKYNEFTLLTPAAFLFPGATGCKIGPSGLATGAFGPILKEDCSGFELTHAPEWSGSLGYTHHLSLGNGGALEAATTVEAASARWVAADFIPTERVGAYATLNATLTYITPDRRVSVTAFVRNLNNAVVYTGGLEGPFTSGIVAANINPPRTYGVRVGAHF